ANAAAILDTLWPATAHRRIAAVAFWVPLLLAILVGLASQVLISSLWIMSAVTLFPVVLLSSPLVGMRRGALPGLLGVAIAVPVLATLAAPAIAYVIHPNGVPPHPRIFDWSPKPSIESGARRPRSRWGWSAATPIWATAWRSICRTGLRRSTCPIRG